MVPLTFFVRHSLSNMNHNRQRTVLVLLSIAVGVAAIVSLRTLGLMVGDSLTQNLQAGNRGDIVVTVPVATIASGETYDEELVDAGDGMFSANSFSQAGLERIRTWSEGRGYEVTAVSRGASPIRIYPEGQIERSEIAFTFFVEPEKYPLYGEIEFIRPGDIALAQALAEPGHIAISERLAKALNVDVGDTLHLVGPDPYLVTALIDNTAEATLQDFNTIFISYVYLRYDVGVETFGVQADTIYLKLPPGSDVRAIGEQVRETFSGVGIFTTEDLWEQNRTLSETLTKLVTTMGLLSLLIGGIGIINTMLVVVSRRTLEIGVLKTVGLQGYQVTLLFLSEAFLLGLLGSILGLLLGLALVVLLQGVAERVFAQTLEFAVYPQAMVMGLVTGVLVTLVFGFLPTLSAGCVRPNVVLYPTDSILPRAGRRRSLLVVIVLTAIMGLLVGQILGDLPSGMGMAYGTVAALGIAILLLRGLVFVLGHLPSFGSASIKLVQRAIYGRPGRTASTLLALVIGTFALSVVLLLTRSVVNTVNDVTMNQLGGNVIVGPETREAAGQVRSRISELAGVKSVTGERIYQAEILAINGNRDVETIIENARLAAREKAGLTGDRGEKAPQGLTDPYRFRLRRFVDSFEVCLASETSKEYTVTKGRDVTPSGDRSIVLRASDETTWLGLDVGDTLTLRFAGDDERIVAIAGFMAEPSAGLVMVSLGDEPTAVGSDKVVPEGLEPRPSVLVLDVEKKNVHTTLSALAGIPDVVVLEVTQLNELADRMFKQLSALPLIVAVLALSAGGIIVANTVSLATLERRRQIGIMKAIGLGSKDILRLLLLENGWIGLVGGVLGGGMGAGGILLFGAVSGSPTSFPFPALAGLILLAVAIALVATVVTAYGASREKPLIVLRYE